MGIQKYKSNIRRGGKGRHLEIRSPVFARYWCSISFLIQSSVTVIDVIINPGGVYIDADSFLSQPLEKVVQPDDEMIVTFETNNYEGDWCYSPNSKLSTIMTVRQHPISTSLNLFHGRNILNWCIMSCPYHMFLRKALENFVHLTKLEYIGLGALKVQKWDQFSKHVYCTTGPSLFTASLREAVIELNERKLLNQTNALHNNHTEPIGYRLASRDFIREGGIFKVINTVHEDKNHYTKVCK